MKRLIYIVRKKTIVFNMSAEMGAANQVRMKCQRPAIGLYNFFILFFKSGHLARGNKKHCIFLVIVMISAVFHFRTL